MTPARLAALHHAAFPDERGWSEAEFAQFLNDPTVTLISREHGFLLGRIIGDEAEVLTLCTAPDARRQGTAQACLTEFLSVARNAQAQNIFLEVAADNLPAITLYQANGFTKAGLRRAYYARATGPKVDAFVLSATL